MKTKIRFLAYFVLGILLVVGSSFAADSLLAYKEKKLLSEFGVMEVETPAFIWEEGQVEGEDGAYGLETEKIEQVLRIWQRSDREVLHEPAGGQISMEKALEAGGNWIRSMTAAEGFPAGLLESGKALADEGSVIAVLSMAVEDTRSSAEPCSSYWKMTFKDQSASIALSVNAVTGCVWEAEFNFFVENIEFSEDFFVDSLQKFLEMSGVVNPVSGCVRRKDGAVYYLADTLIYAGVECEEEEFIYVWSDEGGAKRERACIRLSYALGTIG